MTDEDERRWRHVYEEIPKRSGKISDLEKFDARFFGVHFKQAHTMDPQTRMLVESAYECIMDAGINPKMLRGTRTGVYIGACFAESEKTMFFDKVCRVLLIIPHLGNYLNYSTRCPLAVSE